MGKRTRPDYVREAIRKKMPKKAVMQYDLHGDKLIAKYESCCEAERQTGVHAGNISNCCNGRCITAGGYTWVFAD